VSQAFWTVLGGVTVYVLGQIAVVFYVTPIQQLWRIFGHIQHQLTYFAPAYLSPGSGPNDDASKEFRNCAAQLRACAFAVCHYDRFAAWGIVPPRDSIERASSNLLGLSNGVGPGADPAHNQKYRRNVEDALDLPPVDARPGSESSPNIVSRA
jgi:hypothetical protein